MKKAIAKPLIILITLLTVFSVSFFVYKNTNQTTLLSYKVTSYDEAVLLSETHNLDLDHVSPAGIATFEANGAYHHLLDIGFSVNNTSTIQAPPFTSATDPYISDQYALDLMDTYEAWDVITGNAAVMVAIIDTGIDTNHSEFQGRLSPLSYNASTEQVGLDFVFDDQDHGTPVAGVIAANKDNNEGIAGIAQNIGLLIIKANETNEDAFYDSVLAEAIYYAVDNGADIINMSLGGPHSNQTVQDAITYAYNNGVIVVAAAGNDGIEEPQYPAAYDHVIAVSSVDEDGLLSDFSNFGDYIDITAPGGAIVTTGINDTYYFASGTSFSAPQITGVLALIKSLDTTQSYTDILNNLYGGVTTLTDSLYYGAGLVNTHQSVMLDYIKVTFETAYNPIDAIYHSKDTALTGLPTLTEPDKLFLGWYLDSSLTTPFEAGSILNDDTTLYAKWVDQTYTMTFIDNTTILDETTYTYQDTPTLTMPEKEGYEFDGWYLDPSFTTAYSPEPITEDITLYAKFDPLVYHTVTIFNDNVTLNSYQILDDTTFDTTQETKLHHTFEGYYTDQSLTTRFDPSTPIHDDITLYAKFVPNTYTITYIHNDTVVNEQAITYGNPITLLALTDDTLYFIGWYLSDTFDTAYEKPNTLTGDITLYAYFVSDAYAITLHINESVETQYVLPGSPVDLERPSKTGHVFVDWYIDSTFTTLFTDTTFTQDTTLYAHFVKEDYVVTFYDYDRETIFQEMTVSYNDSLPSIPTPTKPSNAHFTYTFSQWETTSNTVTENIDIYPIFDKQYIQGSVLLNIGIDTVNLYDNWDNTGVLYNEAIINIDTTIPDMSSPGRYSVEYTIYDDDGIYDTVVRIVTITDSLPPLELSLKKGVTSLFAGESFTDPGVTTSRGTLTVESNVNTDVPGVYTITYTLSDQQESISKIRYIHILEPLDTNTVISPIYYSRKKKEAVI